MSDWGPTVRRAGHALDICLFESQGASLKQSLCGEMYSNRGICDVGLSRDGTGTANQEWSVHHGTES